ncbi:hypothetical protein Xekk_00958 [Xenorhabdus sp. KK7.4]|nr:hypothetical protein Xekk_00958 [Xenorhabdus sp. KK7.4]
MCRGQQRGNLKDEVYEVSVINEGRHANKIFARRIGVAVSGMHDK